MDNYAKHITETEEIVKNFRYLKSCENLLYLDSDLFIPAEGTGYRAQMNAFLTNQQSQLFRSQKAEAAADYWAALDSKTYRSAVDRALVRYFLHNRHNLARVPKALLETHSQLIVKNSALLKEARQQNDFQIVRDSLKELLDAAGEIALHINPQAPVMETLINRQFEDGISLAKTKEMIAGVRERSVALLQKIRAQEMFIESGFLAEIPLEPQLLHQFSDEVLQAWGFDFRKGCTDCAQADYCQMLGPSDVRVNANFTNYDSGLWGLFHEAGHGRYGYGTDEELVRRGLWGGLEGSLHESQARFYEQILGRSKAFWQVFYPRFQTLFPPYQDIDLDCFYRAINKVEPAWKRVSADELTYNLHICVRFEMECEYYSHTLDIADFPRVWNEKYQKYLGIEPQDDREGILQDVHWFWGAIGYYQSYLLGNVLDGMFLEQMQRDIPDLWPRIAAGDLPAADQWLQENIHRFGNLYTPPEIVRRITGRELDDQPFMDYLENKYAEIYGFVRHGNEK